MREKWDKAINEIDEKFINETALTYAKNAGKQQELEKYEAESSRPIEFKPLNEQKKSNKAKIIGFSAAAAAVLAVGIGGGVMLSRGNGNDLLVTDTPTIEAVTLGKAFDAADYNFINCVNGENEMQLTDAMINELSEILGRADALAQYDIEGAASGTLAYLYMYPSTSGATEFLRVHELSGKYYYSITRDGDEDNRAYFEMTEDNYTDLIFWFYDYTPECIVGTVIEKDDLGNMSDPDRGIYLISNNANGEVYSIHHDSLLTVDDTVEVSYYGGVMETYPAKLNVYNIEKLDSDVVSIRSAFLYDDFYVTFEYIPVETEGGIEITEPLLYVTNENRSERFEELSADLTGEMPAGSRPVMCEVALSSGNAFAVMIPEESDTDDVYRTYFYICNGSDLFRFTQEGGAEFAPAIASNRFYYSSASDIVSFIEEDGAAHTYQFNCESLEVSPTEMDIVEATNTVSFDKAKVDYDSVQCLFNNFMGKWGNENETVTIDMYESPFSFADPFVGCYEAENGWFMLGESRAWFVNENDPDVLYYFDNVTDGQQINTADYTATYRCLSRPINEGLYGGNAELGYLGLVDFSVNQDYYNPFDVSDFFDMEITDANGTRWVRTPDKNVDWGGMYEINIGGRTAHCLKMQNANNPSEFKYFSFYFGTSDGTPSWEEEQGSFRADSEKSVLTWENEHYSFDVNMCTTSGYPTDFAANAELEATQHGYGKFVVETTFYPCSDGSYYAMRVMGNNQAQWIADCEYFYHDGNDYQLISNELGSSWTELAGDRLYVVYNTLTGLGLKVYEGTELIYNADICNEDQIVQMNSWAAMYGKYYVIQYYKEELQKDVYAVIDTEASELAVEFYEDLQFNDDGTVVFPGG